MKINKFTTLAASIILLGTTSVFGACCNCSCEVPVDIHPTSCPNPLNAKSGGLVPAAFLGTATTGVSLINPLDHRGITITGINGVGEKISVKAVRIAYEDVSTPYGAEVECCDENSCTEDGPDEIGDLTLKFPMKSVDGNPGIADILEGHEKGTVLCLEIEGWGYDVGGITIRYHGKDVIIVK